MPLKHVRRILPGWLSSNNKKLLDFSASSMQYRHSYKWNSLQQFEQLLLMDKNPISLQQRVNFVHNGNGVPMLVASVWRESDYLDWHEFAPSDSRYMTTEFNDFLGYYLIFCNHWRWFPVRITIGGVWKLRPYWLLTYVSFGQLQFKVLPRF